ncbi:recombinase-like helix-turn-helix domain-containing protein [Spongiibacter tropicus]|uniref:recombinase-like helix-turn-helix domain-containing protein n=1 Tax=Spongiibacter tropicus TaxID=454602 RepID=UPI0035BE5C9B
MKREDQQSKNWDTIRRAASCAGCCWPGAPSYQAVVARLNAEGFTTSRGNPWTPQRLRRMLQRHGVSGIWGLAQGQHRQ